MYIEFLVSCFQFLAYIFIDNIGFVFALSLALFLFLVIISLAIELTVISLGFEED
jgi:hypothetical protein